MRRTLIVHPPESNIVLDLMSQAAELLIRGQKCAAEDKVKEADISSLVDWFHYEAQVDGKMLQRNGITRPARPPFELKTQGRPAQSNIEKMFKRDGWHCRFCGIRVIDSKARQKFSLLLPDAMRWGPKSLDRHACQAVLASPDHVLPLSWGGTNSLENLVTACYACQFSRMEVKISDCGIIDPRDRDPIKDSWDGLSKLLQIS